MGRWLPTFLIVDGPIGWFLTGSDSPLADCKPESAPLLNAARQFMQHRDFRLLRNGLAHWAFHWEVVGEESYIVAYDRERDLPTIKLHQREAGAFHITSFAMVEVPNDTVLSSDQKARQFS